MSAAFAVGPSIPFRSSKEGSCGASWRCANHASGKRPSSFRNGLPGLEGGRRRPDGLSQRPAARPQTTFSTFLGQRLPSWPDDAAPLSSRHPVRSLLVTVRLGSSAPAAPSRRYFARYCAGLLGRSGRGPLRRFFQWHPSLHLMDTEMLWMDDLR
jgi:hypothetical protein